MTTPSDPKLRDPLFGTPMGQSQTAGPVPGEFVPPPDIPDEDERRDALPEQEEFWRAPVRFGSIPVEGHPLGWDSRRGFRKLYPQGTPADAGRRARELRPS